VAVVMPALSGVWVPAVLPFMVAMAICVAAVPLTMMLAPRVGAVADASRARDIHDQPTPRLGGLAMMAGFGVAVGVFGGSVEHRWAVVGICAAISFAMVVDDALHLPPSTKLLVELGAGVAVAVAGFTIDFIAVPGGNILHFGILAAPITVAWVVGMQTSINLIDGVDGVAAGVCAIVAGVLLLAAINRVAPGDEVQSGVIVMAGALMGACAGFLIFNFHPASTFMGDSGSHFLALAIMSVSGIAKVALALSMAIPIVAMGMPIGDTAWAIYRRKRHGFKVTDGDAGHIHHRLLDGGMSVRETAVTFWLATAILGCFALALFGHQHILVVAVALLTVSLGALIVRNRRRAMVRPPADSDLPLPPEPMFADDPEYLVVPGRAAIAGRRRHRSEVD